MESIKQKIVVGYVRLSSDDPLNKSLSPEHQKMIIEENAEKHGMKVIRFFEDINKTGSNIFRKGLEALMQEAKERKFNRVVIKDWSRLSRSIVDQETIIKELDQLGIEVFSCDGIVDKKARQVTGLTNEWFVDECRRKQRQVHELKLHEKIPLSRPPMGYRMSRKLKKFVINEEEAEEVKRIFNKRIGGTSINQIAKDHSMSPSKISWILKNRTYLGIIKYDGQEIEGTHEPIIPKDIFSKAVAKSLNNQ